MSDDEQGRLLPLAQVVEVKAYNPPHRLWHVPNTHEGICPGCEQKVDSQPLQFGGHDWHPQCFKCSYCRQPITTGCVQKDDYILHEKCFEECFAERCAKCANLVNPKKALKENDKVYHQECYSCINCGDNDPNLKQKDHHENLFGFPYCIHCFQEVSENFPKCITCKKPITRIEDRTEFFFQGKKYYVHTGDCFKCSVCPNEIHTSECCVCQKSLVCRSCYNKGLKQICAKCNEPVLEKEEKVDGVYFHPEHFICNACHQPLKSNTAVFRNGILKCKSCAAEEGQKCPGCDRPATENVVKDNRGKLWHKACFKCTNCDKNLAAKEIKHEIVRGKPYCQECFERQLKKKK